MADFCKQCSKELLGYNDGSNDMVGLSTPEETIKKLYPIVLCEGCGPIQVDHTGRCMSDDCLKKHNKLI